MIQIKALLEDKAKLPAAMKKTYNLQDNDYKTKDEGNFIVIDIVKDVRQDGEVHVTISDNEMAAFLSIYPPVGGARVLSAEDIVKKVQEDGIVFNINDDALKESAMLHSQGVIVEGQLIASGSEMFKGKDAVITLQFSSAEKKPKVSTDGKVDFKNLDNIIHAKKGDVLISKRPASLGIKGITVKGNETIPEAGRDINIVCGEGVAMNPAGTSYIATHDGYVDFSDNVLSVHEVYYIYENIDFSTGNINFNGTVHIKGDVLSGFKVEAGKDVIVDGICGDCEIIAKKNIRIHTGIKGTGANAFRAGEDVIVGYCEKGKIYARNDLIIKKYAYNSELYAGNNIEAITSEGIIAGGQIKAFSEIHVKQLGTQGNSKFGLFLGTKYYIDHALERIRKQKAKMVEVLGDINDLLGQININNTVVANNPKVVKLVGIKKNFEKIISDMTGSEEILMQDARASKPKVKVKGIVYEGVTVMFFNCATTIKEKQENMVYYLDEKYSEVAWVSLKDAKNSGIE